MTPAVPQNERILVWTPTGCDAQLIQEVCAGAGILASICKGVDDFCAAVQANTGMTVLAEEVLADSIDSIVYALDQQPPWSDMPLIVLIAREHAARLSSHAVSILNRLRNVTLLERPIYPITLLSAIRSALRARHRQFEVAAYLEERITSESELAKRVEERTQQLSAAKEALHRAEKLEAVGRLAGGIAHDFNNLMTGIQGIAQELSDEMPAESRARSDLTEIIAAANKATGLTRQLLAFGRRQVVSPSVLNLNFSIQDLESLFRRILGTNVDLDMKLDPELGNCTLDRSNLEQVLMNLVLNARDAMPDGGRITIETANVFSRVRTPEGSEIPPGRYVMLSVTDTGQGMDEQTVTKIFEPFFTTKELGKGTGLGLATVYGIVKQSGGEISVTSAPGEGTTFRLYFPVSHDPVMPERRGPNRAAFAGGSESVLVVEDEDIVRRVVTGALQKAGYQVLKARDAQEALEIQRSSGQPIDLLLTDVIMPGMNGRELARAMRAKTPELAVLFMSGHPEDVIVQRGGTLEPDIAFIQKSFTTQSLCRKVREVLDTFKKRTIACIPAAQKVY